MSEKRFCKNPLCGKVLDLTVSRNKLYCSNTCVSKASQFRNKKQKEKTGNYPNRHFYVKLDDETDYRWITEKEMRKIEGKNAKNIILKWCY